LRVARLVDTILSWTRVPPCKTAWPVVQIAEEYFILDMVGAELTEQSIDNNGGLCDKMEVSTDKGKATYYFGIAKVFEGRQRLMKK
jgi:hypothetical protein